MTPPAIGDTVRRIDAALRRLAPPYGPLALPAPADPADPLDDIAPDYARLLRLADGATCGAAGEFRLWPAAEVRTRRRIADDLPGGPERWCPIGDVLDNPFCLRRSDGHLWWFGDLDIVWYTDTELATFTEAAPDLITFLDRYLLGPDYATLVGVGADNAWLTAIS